MRSNNNYIQILVGMIVLPAALLLSSCKKYVELGAPPTQVQDVDVYKSDMTATSAVLGLYSGGALSNLIVPLTTYPGMSADDVQYNTVSPDYVGFETDAVSINNNLNAGTLWYYCYQYLRNINYAVDGLTASNTLTPAVKNQLLGEAKFLRAFMFFELVNFYGDVPMPVTGNDLQNAYLPRTAAKDVWTQIIADLKDAQSLLPEAYTGTFRARINKWAATALLARVDLYNKDYPNAEAEATKVINSGVYSIVTPLNSVFVNNSNEIIWQITNTTGLSAYGPNFVPATGYAPAYSLYDTLYKSFETGDLRKTNWAGVTTISGTNYYYINKYKLRSGTGNEYNVAMRFAELYLIRAEARAQQNNLTDAKTDIDVIRARAGLAGVSAALSQSAMLLAIEQERKVELFGEWGHRWFDLKRTNRAATVIGGQKPATWKNTAVLYPIPDAQRLINTSLTQNDGY
jgi:hypothetical protein